MYPYMSTKRQFFEHAVRSLKYAMHPSPSGYICPICLKIINDINELTYEHVPPKSLGGKKLCLTCRCCNSTAGYTIDSAMHREQGFRNFLSPNGHRSRVKIEVEGQVINAEMFQEPNFTNIKILPNNNPAVANQVEERIMDSGSAPPSINITVWGGYRQKEADVGYLRAAYLAAFAKFGYRWIFTSETHIIRRQIQNPRDTLIQNFRVGLSHKSGHTPDGFYILKTPLTALLVRIGNNAIYLPWPRGASAKQISEWINSEKEKGKSCEYTYQQIAPWPTGLELIFDQPAKTST